jgi:NTP pyrophosphatase (non-canonical NTP hydrolase)
VSEPTLTEYDIAELEGHARERGAWMSRMVSRAVAEIKRHRAARETLNRDLASLIGTREDLAEELERTPDNSVRGRWLARAIAALDRLDAGPESPRPVAAALPFVETWAARLRDVFARPGYVRESAEFIRALLDDARCGDMRPVPARTVSVERWRPEVVVFADAMESKLKENDWKGGWKNCDAARLLERVREEVDELAEAVAWERRGDNERAVIGREAADVANMAMMVADVCGALGITVTDKEPAS